MIRVKHEEAVHLHLFLAPVEIESLEDFAASVPPEEWEKGRQGSEYYKASIKEMAEQGLVDDDLQWLYEIADRAQDELRHFTGVNELDDQWDMYLLFYPHGSQIPPHKDPAPEGMKHVRLNAVITPPLEGGAFTFSRRSGCRETNFHYRMGTPGEAIIFSPSDFEHQVQPLDGTRLVLSVGCLVPKS